jgi:small-conductance mechanosensitive channel
MKSGFPKLHHLLLAGLLLVFHGVPVLAQVREAPAQSAPKAASKPAAVPASSDLKRAMDGAADEIEKRGAELRARTTEASRELVQVRKSAEELEQEVALVRAVLALEEPPLQDVQAYAGHFANRRRELNAQIAGNDAELENLRKVRDRSGASLQQLRKEVERLKASRMAGVWNDSLDEAFDAYQRRVLAHDRAAERLLEMLVNKRELFDGQSGLLDEITPQLAQMTESWNAELLKREKPLSLGQEIAQSWRSILSVPERVTSWAVKTLESGAIQKFMTRRPGFVIGLLSILLLFLWGGPRLKGWLTPWFVHRESQAGSMGFRVLFRFSRYLVSRIVPILLALWVFMALRALEWTETRPGLIILDTLGVLIGLSLFLRLNRSLFGAGGEVPLLPLEKVTATFYRRNLRALLVYTALAILAILVIHRLAFPGTVAQLMRYLLETGWVVGVVRLLRPDRLDPLAEQLSPADWGRERWTRRTRQFRGVLMAFLVLDVLVYLVGFQGLATFAMRAMTVSLGLALLWGMASLVGRLTIHFLLHDEQGWLMRKLPDRSEILGRLCEQLQRVLQVVLLAALALSLLAAWGIEPSRLLGALQWLKWEIPFGSVHLSPMKLLLAVLAIYLGIWFSRLLAQLLDARVFPRTGWDIGIQYTISTILRYLLLTLAGLLALDILGFPLSNLALVMGAVGVGVGLGLQNMVSNFFSGLILLIERPIKVGDLLVIDGQWGEVKEIRIRATLFQTFDKSVLIIPNSDLTSGKILNWTHYGRGVTRITLQVGVSYDSDVRQVTRILRDLCRENARVMADPPPNIAFSAYGESSLDFNIMVHVRAPEDRIPATHELNTAIFDAFREHGIEIPFPQRDLTIKNWPRGLTGEGEAAAGDAETGRSEVGERKSETDNRQSTT